MRNFFNLVKIQFLSYFGINKLLHSKKRRINMGISGLIFVGLLFAAALIWFGYTYSEMFADALVYYGNIIDIIPIMLSISGLVCFFFAFYSTSNVLYGFKDYEMISAMPIKTHTVVLAKLFYMYVADLIFMALISFPSLFVYVQKGGEADLGIVIRTTFLILSLPAFSLSLAVIIGSLVALISARFRRKNIIQIILLIIFFIGIFALSFLSGSGEYVDIGGAIGKIYFIYPLVVSAVSRTGMTAIVFFGCAAIVSAVTFAVCKGYKRMNTMLLSKRTTGKFRMKNYSVQSQGKCLFKKETGRLFSVAMYAVNALFGSLMSIVTAIVLAVVFSRIEEGKEVFAVIAVFLPCIFTFMHILAPTTSCSISLEGKCIWLLKTSPVDLNKLFAAKLGVNAVFNAIPALISSLIITIFLSLSAVHGTLLILIAVFAALLGGNIGLLFDLRFPTLKWDNEVKPVKQGVALLLTMLCSFVLTIAFFLIVYYVKLSTLALFGILAGITVTLTAVTFVLVFTEGKKLFSKISG